MLITHPTWLLRYGLAIAATGVVTLLSLALYPAIQRVPFLLFFGAMAVSVGYGGLGPGLLTTVLSILIVDDFLLPPAGTFVSTLDLLVLTLFLIVALAINWIYVARQRAEAAARAQGEWLRTALASIGDGVIITNADGIVTFINPIAETLTGWERTEAINKEIEDIFKVASEDSGQTLENPIGRVLREKVIVGLANHSLLIARDGSTRPIDDTGAPILNAQGKLLGTVLVFKDVSERKRADHWQQFLLKVSSALASSLDYETTLQSLANLIVPELADNCVIDVLDEAGLLQRVAVAATESVREDVLRDLMRRYPPDPQSMTVRPVVDNQQPRLVKRITDEFYESVARDSEHAALMRSTGGKSMIVMPLIVRDQSIGGITIATAESGRYYSEEDIPLIRELAGRAAFAVENARLYRASRLAEQRIGRQAAYAEVLAKASRSFSEAVFDLQSALGSCVREVAEVLGDHCALQLLDEDGQTLRLMAVHNPNAEAVDLAKTLLDALPQQLSNSLSGRVASSGEAVFLPSVTPESLKSSTEPQYHPFLEQVGIHALIVVPLRARGRAIGTLSISRDTPDRPYTPEDLTLVQELADRAAIAVDNARLYQQAREEVVRRRQAEVDLRQSETRLRMVLENMPVMVTAFGTDGTYSIWNRECERVTGYAAHEIIGNPKAVELLYPELDYRGATMREWRDHLGDFRDWERELTHKDGSRRLIAWSSISRQVPIPGWLGWGIGVDITERKRTEERIRFLLDATLILNGSLNQEETADSLARLAVSFLSDWCVVDVLESDGLFHRLAAATADPSKEHLVRMLQQNYPTLDPGARHKLLRVFQSKQSWLDPEVSPERLAAEARDAVHLALEQDLGFRSEMVIPLLANDQILGTITLVSASRSYTESDLTLANDLARRGAICLDKARLYRQADEERERWHVTLSSIGDAVITTNDSGQVTFLNPVAQSLTGWTLENAFLRPLPDIFNIINEQSRQAVENPVERVLREQQVVGLANHTLLIARDGREIPIDDSGAPIRDTQGLLSGVVLVFRDITDRKRAEHRTEHLKDIASALSGAVTPGKVADIFIARGSQAVGADAAWIVLLTEDDTLRLMASLGLAPDLVANWQKFSVDAGTPAYDVVRLRQPVWLASLEERTARYPGTQGAGPQFQASVALPLIVQEKVLGGLIFSFTNSQTFRDEDQAFMLALAGQCAQALERANLYAMEFDARHAAEQARQRLEFLSKAGQLLSSSLNYDVTFRTLKDILLPNLADIYAIDVVQVDQSVRRIAMAAPDPMTEEAIRELESRSDNQLLLNSPEFRAGQSIFFEHLSLEFFEAAARDAHELALFRQIDATSEIIIPLRVRENVIGILTVVRRGARPPYTQSDLLVMEELASRIAQSVENARLYAEVQAHAEVLEERVAERTSQLEEALKRVQAADSAKTNMLSNVTHEMRTPLSSIIGFSNLILRRDYPEEKRNEFIHIISTEATRMASLVDNFLDLQRILTGRQVFQFSPVDLGLLIQDICNSYPTDNLGKNRLTLHLETIPNVIADAEHIRRVIINLLSNAIKYSPDGGVIDLSLQQGENEVILAVRDNGIGIPLDELDQLFSRFQRGRQANRMRIQGTGLGLALSKEIIEAHHGRIWAESDGPGLGACFKFALPAV